MIKKLLQGMVVGIAKYYSRSERGNNDGRNGTLR